MSKNLNKRTAKLLSGIIISSIAITPVNVSALENEDTTEIVQLTETQNSTRTLENEEVTATQPIAESRATKTGVVNTTALNVRSGSSISYSVVGTVVKGNSVQIESILANGWYKIKYGNLTGYVNGKYISDVQDSSSSNSTTTTKTGTVNTAVLNVRSGSSTSYSKIGSLTKGTKVEIIETASNGWHKIKYGNGTGYVSGLYITNITTSSGSNSNSTSSNTSNATQVVYTAIVNTDSLNVRTGGSTSYTRIGSVTRGTKVEIVDKMANGWSKIKYNNGYGYVNTSYLTSITTPSTTPSTDLTVIKTGTVNTAVLNVRSGSSTYYSKIGSLTKGTKVEIVKVESNGWYKIKYANGTGFVSGLYINIPGETKNLNNFLFIGDSFTVLLSNTIKSKNDNVYIHAKSGSMPSYWLDKVSSMPANSQVDGIVLLIGVNGAGYESNKTDTKNLINKLSARYPNKTIYVQKIFPVGKNFTTANPTTFNQKIATLNSVVEAHCKTVPNAKFIDTTSGFVDKNGYLINTYDGLHISSTYNTQFYNNILNAVKNAK